VSFGAVRLLWKWDEERIVELQKAAVWTGRHPAVCKRASAVVIRKGVKDHYTNLKAYRSIALLGGLWMVVEKVIAVLLAEEAGR